MRAEMRHEGRYILKSDDQDLGAMEAVGVYKQLNMVEQGFRDLKDVIEMRPIYHQRDRRIEAHVFVATLALFLKRVLEHQPATTLPQLSSTEAIAAMRSVSLVQLNMAGKRARLVTHGGRDARRIVKALQIKSVDSPPRATTIENNPPMTVPSAKLKNGPLFYKDLQTQRTNMG